MEQLAAEARTGNREALEQLCSKVRGPLYAVARRILSHHEDAEDAAQAALLKIATKIGEFRGECCFSSWAFQIAKNEAVQLLRQRYNVIPTRSAGNDEVAVGSTAERALFMRELMEHIAQSSPQYCAVLRAYFILGYSQNELAEQYGITERTVKMRVFRGVRELRARCEVE